MSDTEKILLRQHHFGKTDGTVKINSEMKKAAALQKQNFPTFNTIGKTKKSYTMGL